MDEDTDIRTLEAQRRERRFALFGAVVMLAGLVLIAAMVWFAVPTPPGNGVGPVSDFLPAEHPYIGNINSDIYFYYVVNSGEMFIVLDPVAPSPQPDKLRCRAVWDRNREQFVDPCYGSKFTLTGEWTWGPAPRGMDRFGYTVENGILIVNRWQRSEGDPHP